MTLQTKVALALVALFIVGAGIVVYWGRPVVALQQQNTANGNTNTGLSFSLADVQAHGTSSDCWTAINGSVYDLSSWVSRHPGGAPAIVGMCGIDSSASFNAQHGRSRSAKSALQLLLIGSLN